MPDEISFPRALPTEIVRLSDNGDGFVIWAHTTFNSLDDVLRDGYFEPGRTGFSRNDRIECTTEANSRIPVHATLIVTCAQKSKDVETALLHGPISVATAEPTCWETLGLKPDADETAVKNAYRQAAKSIHPDKQGGSESAMERLNKARDDAMNSLAAKAA